jgi:hypothetical protein
MANMSIDTDPQQQEAALPQGVVVRSFSRYVAQGARLTQRPICHWKPS